MRKKLEVYFFELIQGQKKGFLALSIKIFLHFLSWFYQLLISCRNWAFDRGYFKPYDAPVPLVISVGNIVVGGTGKTPVTLMLAREFYDDFPIAILSRGYRSRAEYLPSPITLSHGNGPLHPASFCGDEPYLLAQNLPKAHVFVGKNRHLSSNLAAKAGAQLILLDDGMQHRQLARHLEVIVINALDPFGQGYFLPRGLLRESVTSLARADLIILNHVHEKEQFEAVKNEIIKFTKAPLMGTKMEVEKVLNLDGCPVELQGKKVGIFCAVAHPEYFHCTVKNLGTEIVGQTYIPDHLTFKDDKLIPFCKDCQAHGAEWILCTEKDVVKLDKSVLKDLPIAWVKMRLVIVEGENHWKNFTENAKVELLRNTTPSCGPLA